MNNKKKLIIVGIVIIVLIILPIIVIGNIRTLKYNEEGKPIVYSNKEMNELEDGTELENKKQQIQDIIKKYYGTEYAENLFSNITKEINEQEGQYKVPESSKELLRKNIELYNSTEITSEEREAIKYYLEIIDRSFIEDKDLLKAIESTGVERK